MNGRRCLTQVVGAACAVMVLGVSAAAQGPQPQAASRDRGPRYQLAMMEKVLEAAVQQGARIVSREWRAVSPDVLFMNGNARVRGFRLENYGVFFDVEVPSMSQSFIYSWRLFERDAAGAEALRLLKENLAPPTDPARRKSLDQAVRILERQIGPAMRASGDPAVLPQGGVNPNRTLVNEGAALPRPSPGAPVAPDQTVTMLNLPASDPNEAYTTEVKNALIDAMLDHSHALTIGPDEWLAVAAHDAADRQLGAGDSYDAVTMLMRIKGADLDAFRSGRLSRADALRRIEVREY